MKWVGWFQVGILHLVAIFQTIMVFIPPHLWMDNYVVAMCWYLAGRTMRRQLEYIAFLKEVEGEQHE